MLLNNKIVVIPPAYRAEKTLQRTVDEIPRDIVDEILLVDDCSNDRTVAASDARRCENIRGLAP
jgi:glycosyltransferase involved in cell wall biosynthesis